MFAYRFIFTFTNCAKQNRNMQKLLTAAKPYQTKFQ